jgi:septin family protein
MPMMESQEGSSTNEDNLESDENQFCETLQKYNEKLDEKQATINLLKNQVS